MRTRAAVLREVGGTWEVGEPVVPAFLPSCGRRHRDVREGRNIRGLIRF